jgi:hypothetical protein
MYNKIHNIEELIERSFDAFYGMIRDAPGYVRERELAVAPLSSRSGKTMNAVATRNSRKDLSRVVSPLETASLRKRPHGTLIQLN